MVLHVLRFCAARAGALRTFSISLAVAAGCAGCTHVDHSTQAARLAATPLGPAATVEVTPSPAGRSSSAPLPVARKPQGPPGAPHLHPAVASAAVALGPPRGAPKRRPAPPANVAPPDAPPRIVAMHFPPAVHSGQTLDATVTTTTNVASCELRVFGNVIPMQRPHAGAFVLHYGIPSLPFIFNRTYDVEVTAHNAAGVTTTSHVALRLE